MDLGHPNDIRSWGVNASPEVQREEWNVNVLPFVRANQIEDALKEL